MTYIESEDIENKHRIDDCWQSAKQNEASNRMQMQGALEQIEYRIEPYTMPSKHQTGVVMDRSKQKRNTSKNENEKQNSGQRVPKQC